ncbi:MAG: hypothetical protein GWN86_07520 [Desulfobacterales bacterium]|nr:hypothetical protein [Desulfobacterales bacterium]
MRTGQRAVHTYLLIARICQQQLCREERVEGAGGLPPKKCKNYKELQRGTNKIKTVSVKCCWFYRYLPLHFGTQV